MSTDIAPIDPNNVLALSDSDEWSDVDTGFIGEAPPNAAPVVPMFSFNAKVGGGFHDELTDDHIGEGGSVRAVWLAWSESRAYWKEEFGKGDKAPTCRSTNMIVPDDGSTEKQAAACAECPKSRWTDNPPECGMRINVMLYLPDQQRITRTSFAGLAIKHVQRYLGGFSTRLPQRPPMASITEISVGYEETAFGKFLVPNFRIAGDISRGEAAPLIALRDELRKQWEALSAQDLAEATSDAPTPGPFDKPANAPADIVYEDDEEPF